GLWPLSRRKRVGLRLASLVLSPVVWITVALLLKAAQPVLGLRFLLFAVLVQGLSIAATRLAVRIPRGNLLRDLPRLPGTLGSLVQKDLRQMLSVLDPYIALLLCLAASLYRLSGRPLDPEALPVLSLLVALALSTYSQCLFGLDLASGLARYRLLPLRGWQILLAKDAAFLLVLFLLVLPLAPLPGLAGGLVALAIGHHASVRMPMPQHRWRFTGGILFPTGAVQVAAMMSTGIAAARQSPLYAAAALAFYLGSVWYCGRLWDRGESV
ncbi:MAG TPA: hypothetical protein VG672_09625, partial [Bryobacteraceae bacterium]|nr:hypothetical protein [Bryobacteraceae bacterium]